MTWPLSLAAAAVNCSDQFYRCSYGEHVQSSYLVAESGDVAVVGLVEPSASEQCGHVVLLLQLERLGNGAETRKGGRRQVQRENPLDFHVTGPYPG